MPARPRWSDADLIRAERLFRTSTLSLGALALETGVPRSTLALRARANGWTRSPDRRWEPPPSLRRATLRRSVNAAAKRRELALRALAAAERQMADIEARAARGSFDIIEEERSARVLSATIRTLRELATLEARAAESARALGDVEPGARADDPPRRSLAEIREDFWQRLQKLYGDEPSEDALVLVQRPAPDGAGEGGPETGAA